MWLSLRSFILPVSTDSQGRLAPRVSASPGGGAGPGGRPPGTPRCAPRPAAVLAVVSRGRRGQGPSRTARSRGFGPRSVAVPRLVPRRSFLLAVRVSRALAARDTPGAALPRRRRAAHLYPADRAVAEFGVEPLDEHRGKQPDLGGPGGRVGGDRELAVGEA